MLAAATNFPDSFIRLIPNCLQVIEKRALHGPGVFVYGQFPAAPLMECIHDLAKDIELQLGSGGIANSHRFGSLIARQPRDLPFRQAPLAQQAVHDLHLRRLAGHGAQQPRLP